MTKKTIIPTHEAIRKTYIEVFLKRRSDAEYFANFTEKELPMFIRKHEDSNFAGIYDELDHNYYDRVRNKIAINSAMRDEDNTHNNRFSQHLKTWSDFLESQVFKALFKRKVKAKETTKKNEKTKISASAVSEAKPFREETEGERKHVTKEMDVIYRNPSLRQQCLDKYGYQCQCCGMDFAEMYGEELGANFIEVHHLRPISTFEKDGVPENFLGNLVPLCSNCHSMIHHIKDSEHTLRDLREAYRGVKKGLKIIKDD